MRASTDGLPIERDLSLCFDSTGRNALQPGNAAISRSETTPLGAVSTSWWSELSHAHWWVLIVAVLGWLFDAMDQRLFILARTPALRDLLPASAAGQLPAFAGWATGLFIAGWATGGLLFGLLGDRWGRVHYSANVCETPFNKPCPKAGCGKSARFDERGVETEHGRDDVTPATERAGQQGTQTST